MKFECSQFVDSLLIKEGVFDNLPFMNRVLLWILIKFSTLDLLHNLFCLPFFRINNQELRGAQDTCKVFQD